MTMPSDVTKVLADLAVLHAAKSHDYAQDGNPFSNFEEAAASAGVPVDTVFAVMLGIKQARLKELQGAGKTPRHESVADTQIDLALYAVLRAAYARRQQRLALTPDTIEDYAHGV
jgi:hypothetical protein